MSVRPPRTVAWACLLLLATAAARSAAADDAVPPAVRWSLYGGVNGADIGGGREINPVVGMGTDGLVKFGEFALALGAEYGRLRGEGRVARWDAGTMTMAHEGTAELSLRYIAANLSVQYRVETGGVRFRPNLGLSPTFIVDQAVETATPSGDIYTDFAWYRSTNLAALAGLGIDLGRLLLDATYSAALGSLHAPDADRADGPTLDADPDARLHIWRIAGGMWF